MFANYGLNGRMSLFLQVGINAMLAGRITKTLNEQHIRLCPVQGFGKI